MDSAPVMVCRRFKPPGVQVVDRDWSRTVDLLVSCDLVETELRRIVVREGIDQGVVTWILDGVGLAALDRTVYRGAGLLPMPYLGTLDALHLEAAM